MSSKLTSLLEQKEALIDSLTRGPLFRDFDDAYNKLPKAFKYLADYPETVLDTIYKGKEFYLHTDDISLLKEEVYALNWVEKTLYYGLDARAAMVPREYRKYFKRHRDYRLRGIRLTTKEYIELNLFREWLLSSNAYSNAVETGDFSFVIQTEQTMRSLYFLNKAKALSASPDWDENPT